MRAKILVLLALVYITSGLQLLLSNIPAAALYGDPSLQAHLEIFTPTQVAWLFIGLGLVGVATVLMKKPLWGYFPFMFVSSMWGLLYLVSWYETGYWRSVFGAVIYVLIVGILFVSSKTVEMPTLLEKFFKDEVAK